MAQRNTFRLWLHIHILASTVDFYVFVGFVHSKKNKEYDSPETCIITEQLYVAAHVAAHIVNDANTMLSLLL